MDLSHIYGEFQLKRYTAYRLFHCGDIDFISGYANEIALGCMFDHLICRCLYIRSSNLQIIIIIWEYGVASCIYESCNAYSGSNVNSWIKRHEDQGRMNI